MYGKSLGESTVVLSLSVCVCLCVWEEFSRKHCSSIFESMYVYGKSLGEITVVLSLCLCVWEEFRPKNCSSIPVCLCLSVCMGRV